MNTPLVFTRTFKGQTCTATLTPLGTAELEFRLHLNGVEIVADRDVAEFESSADRDQALAETVALYEANGYERVA